MLTFHLLIYYILPQKHTEILVLVRLFYDDAFLNEFIEKDEIDRINNKKVFSIENGLKKDFDFILISILGREEQVIDSLINEYKD